MKQTVASILCAALLVSCAGSLPYASDYPLTDQTFRSRDGVFMGRVPRGWFSSNGDTLVPALVAWLVKEDLSAAVGIKELSLDRGAAGRVEKDGLALLASIDASLRSGGPDSANVVSPPKEFELQGKRFCGYEMSVAGKPVRIVVFSAGGRYYACEASAVKGRPSAEEAARMFTAQQTFLSTLKF